MNFRVAFLFFVAGLSIPPAAVSGDNICIKALSNASTAFFGSALSLSGLNSTLCDSSLNVTVFAPSNAALLQTLGELGLAQANAASNAVMMAPILLYHVVQPAMNSSILAAGGNKSYANAMGVYRNVTSLAVIPVGGLITVSSTGTDAHITIPDIQADSAIIHVIDAVLLPFYPSALAALERKQDLSIFLTKVVRVADKLSVRLGPLAELTVFAPSNLCFTTSLSNRSSQLQQVLASNADMSYVYYLLSYHIIPNNVVNPTPNATGSFNVTTLAGLKLTLTRASSGQIIVMFPSGNATITDSHLVGFRSDGTSRAAVHVIDQVLVPPPAFSNISDVLKVKGDATIFLAVLNSSSLYSSLLSSSSFRGSILVPSDAALKKRNFTREPLQAATNQKDVLDAHIIKNTVVSTLNIANGTILTTAGGVKLTVLSSSNGNVTFVSGSVLASAQLEYNAIDIGDATIIFIDAVLFTGNLAFQNGTASLAEPSPFTMLFCGLLAAALPFTFSRHWTDK